MSAAATDVHIVFDAVFTATGVSVGVLGPKSLRRVKRWRVKWPASATGARQRYFDLTPGLFGLSVNFDSLTSVSKSNLLEAELDETASR
jgi:hypothetical protein